MAGDDLRASQIFVQLIVRRQSLLPLYHIFGLISQEITSASISWEPLFCLSCSSGPEPVSADRISVVDGLLFLEWARDQLLHHRISNSLTDMGGSDQADRRVFGWFSFSSLWKWPGRQWETSSPASGSFSSSTPTSAPFPLGLATRFLPGPDRRKFFLSGDGILGGLTIFCLIHPDLCHPGRLYGSPVRKGLCRPGLRDHRKATGGPGLASVITSALFGTVSGSAVANVVVDGVYTIPLMKPWLSRTFCRRCRSRGLHRRPVHAAVMEPLRFFLPKFPELPTSRSSRSRRFRLPLLASVGVIIYLEQ